MKPLLLASASPRRRQLVESLGLPFRVEPSRAEELRQAGGGAEELVRTNAWLKASEVARRHPGHWVLGADTVVAASDRVLGKPADMEEARRMLEALQGRTHRVLTGACLCRHPGDRRELWHEATRVEFRALDARAIDRYLSGIHPLDKAGAYAIQEGGEFIVGRVEGSYSNVVGLPMESLERRLGSLGIVPSP